MNLNAPTYSDSARLLAVSLMDGLRDRCVLPHDALREGRFNSNSHTLWVLESQASEAEFNEDPAFHVFRALVESARSDYWYKYEKDYGAPDDYFDYDDDEDYEVEE